jgi:hypothetical protein
VKVRIPRADIRTSELQNEMTGDCNEVWVHTGIESVSKLNTVINTLPMMLKYRFRTKITADADIGLLHILDTSMSNVNTQS